MRAHAISDNKLIFCEKATYTILLKHNPNDKKMFSFCCSFLERELATTVLHMLLDKGMKVELYYRNVGNTLTRI
jgi:hypothetical protein